MECQDIPIYSDGNRIRPEKSEVLNLICDNSKAKSMIGWSPRYSLDEGLKETIDWVRQNKNIYKSGVYNI